MQVGFIGLGNMGEPMARNLMRAGHRLTIYNRTRQRAEALGGEGARIADTPADAAAEAEVLITMLADDRAVRSVLLGAGPDETSAIDALAPEAVHMSASTIGIECSKELEREHRARRQGYVATPVIGRAEAARDKALWVIAAGAPKDIERCRPLMEALGRGITIAGEEPWQANLTKIGVNFMLATVLEAFGEVYAMLEKSGIDPHSFLDVANNGAFRSPVYANYGRMIADRQYEPAGFSLKLGLKDAELALEAGDAVQAPLPFASVLRDHYLQALAHGHGELDWSAVAEVARHNAGVDKALKAGG
ncbi:MAG: NAD(P)-dependent oxidoreductase [Bryobacteraceae bacterium]|jgi:3-hydroxyisobutyrate dehydrogenase-like beta-hydroxyacid dehydrogenase